MPVLACREGTPGRVPRLVCAECGAEADDHAAGWEARLARDDNDGQVDGIEVFCAICASGEFPTALPDEPD